VADGRPGDATDTKRPKVQRHLVTRRLAVNLRIAVIEEGFWPENGYRGERNMAVFDDVGKTL